MSSNALRTAVVACVAVTCSSLLASPGDTLRVALQGWVELELVEVSGTSQIPLEYLYTGKNRDKLSEVSSPTYWIGKFEITQKQYESVMQNNPSFIKGERLPVTNVRWVDAVEFCDRVNHLCHGTIPDGYRFDLPTLVEWAHAFRCGDTNMFAYAGDNDIDKVAWHGAAHDDGDVTFDAIHIAGLKNPNKIKAFDMSGNVAEFAFIADAKGGNIRLGGSYMWPEQFCEITGVSRVAAESRASDLGFRIALVPVDARDPNGTSSSMGTKGLILQKSGYASMARKYLNTAMGLQGLGKEEQERIRSAWVMADRDCGYFSGNWRGLVIRLAQTLGGVGDGSRQVIAYWGLEAPGIECSEERLAIRKLYAKHGIYGMMMDIVDLPPEVRTRLGPTVARKVQAVSCDFNGDGLKDLIVELAGNADTTGDAYGFFERVKDGGYQLVGEPIRVVGLAIMPQKDAPPLFIALIKITDDVISPSVLNATVVSGKTCLCIAWPFERSYCLTELEDERVMRQLPFMGRRNQQRIAAIAEGNYLRPLCWPWKR